MKTELLDGHRHLAPHINNMSFACHTSNYQQLMQYAPKSYYNTQLSLILRSTVLNDQEKHMYCTNKFIELANELKKEDIDNSMVSGSLMTASCIYSTYVAAGNNGALESSGIDKVVQIYRRTLEHHQAAKKAQLQGQAKS